MLGFLRFTVTTEDENYDSNLLGYARESSKQLKAEIDAQVRKTLGPEFEVESVEFNEGSIEAYVHLAAVGTILMAFSKYESFIKSVNLLISQLKGLLQRFFSQGAEQPSVSVTGRWVPGPVISEANQAFGVSSGIDSSQFVLPYLVLSHAAILGVLLWLVIRHLK